MVFQAFAVWPHLTIFENVAFPLRVRNLPREEIRARTVEALTHTNLLDVAEGSPDDLSGGGKQRVALARALAIRPDVMLLDEPLSSLDPHFREEMRFEIKDLQRRFGFSILYVTHDQSEAMALADRVVLMNAGHIVESGEPRHLYRAPRHRFTAEFLGHTNILSATAGGGHLRFPWGQTVPAANGAAHASGEVVLSVRPEDIRLRLDESGPGTVADVTFLGADVEHKVAFDGRLVRVRSSGGEAPVLSPGTRVAVDLPAEIHLLSEQGAAA
jgi:ABC-type Fe3+/spermidine/putrescine transport system ATPase subunit